MVNWKLSVIPANDTMELWNVMSFFDLLFLLGLISHSWAIFNPPFIWFLQWNDRLRGSTGEVLAKYPLCAALCVGCRSIRRVMWELIVCGTGPMVTIGTLELDTGVSGPSVPARDHSQSGRMAGYFMFCKEKSDCSHQHGHPWSICPLPGFGPFLPEILITNTLNHSHGQFCCRAEAPVWAALLITPGH